MADFRFIHAADLHLESPYQGLHRLDEELGKALVRRGRKAFEHLIGACLEEKVDFLLLAGDTFDSAAVSLGAQAHFYEGLRKLREGGITVYLICGNHDPFDHWSKGFRLPDNVHRFPAGSVERRVFSRGGKDLAAVYGVSFGQREEYQNFAVDFRKEPGDPFAIGLLHGAVSGNKDHEPYCPFSLEDLRRAGMDYWALGHIHKAEVLQEVEPRMVYPGNLQGRHFKETGPKGAELVEVSGQHLTADRFLPLAEVEFRTARLDLNGVEDESGLFDRLRQLRETLLGEGRSVLLRLQVTGQTPLFFRLSEERQVEALRESFQELNDYESRFIYLEGLDNQTTPPIDLTARQKGDDFVGELLRHFAELENGEESLGELLEELAGEIRASSIAGVLPEGEGALLKDPHSLLVRGRGLALRGLLKEVGDEN
ncbi:MAG: DNA repair exonuclease [Opitutales bacterium]|nr:DNA repair exonuclease [Opitutales bacterium]